MPYETYDLVKAIKETVKIPVQIHSHFTAGIADMVMIKAIEAGADVIDTAMSPLALGTSHPATEAMVAALKGTPYDTGLDLKKLSEISAYFPHPAQEVPGQRPAQPQNAGGGHQCPDLSGARWHALQPGQPAQTGREGRQARRSAAGGAAGPRGRRVSAAGHAVLPDRGHPGGVQHHRRGNATRW